ncbi:MAG: hypothetical protein ACLFQV_11060, partial [Vulcanimicrobiota bacterium]
MENHIIFEGKQFIFIKPENNPVTVQITDDISAEGKEHLYNVTQPTVFPRIGHNINIKDVQYFSGIGFSNYHLATVITDRKVYKTGDKVKIFAFHPQKPDIEAGFEVKKNESIFYRKEFKFNNNGIYIDELENLDEGEYEVSIITDEECFTCEFVMATYSLSFLKAELANYNYEHGNLETRLQITSGTHPYKGKITARLYCNYCQHAINVIETTIEDGKFEETFPLNRHTGPFHMIVNTPYGDVTSVDLPKTSSVERERVILSSMGHVFEGGLLDS